MDKIFKAIKSILIKFIKDSCLVRASGLAYSSLLSIVPFITVIYAFGGFDNIGKSIVGLLLKVIAPTQQEAVLEIINNFTRNSLATGTVGMLFFLITTLFLINNITGNFDSIWGVNASSGLFRKFTTYTAILVFGSLILGISISFIDSFEYYIKQLTISDTAEYKKTINNLIPLVVTVFTFFIMLKIVPTIKIKAKSAFIGAVISALLFEVIKVIFKYWVLNSVRNSVIYGSLAIIPIFLVGLYLFWLIILIGVEISYYIENRKDPTNGNHLELNTEEKLIYAFSIFIVIAQNYRNNYGGVSVKTLENSLNIPSALIRYFLDIFQKNTLIQRLHSKKIKYIPGKSLDNLYLKDIAKTILGSGNRTEINIDIAKINALGFCNSGFDALSDNSILELVKNSNCL